MRRAFTLVEMLVATALVMLMMLLFAEIFGAAIGTMTAQRGIANNDQKARSFTTILRHDLLGRTYGASLQSGATRMIAPGLTPQWSIQESPQGIVPQFPGDPVDARQLGYFYYSENDIDDDTDDVLQFTARIPATTTDTAPSPYYGRARSLQGPPAATDNPNQPERDDGIAGNGAGTSRAAEITYFMRGGNLYRRVMLLRDPLPNDPPFSTQPRAGIDDANGPYAYPANGATPFFDQPYTSTFVAPPPPPHSFYRDWDFSGTRVQVLPDNGPAGPDPEGTDVYSFHFHSVDSLDNSVGLTNTPLGVPWNRFGFYSRKFSSGVNVNRPVEYLFDNAGNPRAYVGRFTHEETSTIDFDWPGVEQGPGANILLRTDLVVSPQGIVAIDVNGSGAYEAASDTLLIGTRSGEDILLTNVEAFDIELWDSGFREVDVNADGWTPFDPQDDPNNNGTQDSGSWQDVGHGASIGNYRASARANSAYGPGGIGNRVYDTWHQNAGVDFDNPPNGISPAEQSPPFRPLQVDPNPTGGRVAAAWVASTFSTITDRNTIVFPNGTTYGYAVVTPGTTSTTAPLTWPPIPGVVISDGGVRWKCFDNRIGLEQFRITVRYRDIQTGQSRQVTLVHSLVD